MLNVVLTSVSAPPVSASVLVATAGVITVVITLVATTTATSEPTLPVVKAFIRGRAGLAALLIVLLQQIFSIFTLQLDEGHGFQEVTGVGESEVGFRRDRGNHGEQRYTHPAIVGWKERKKGVGGVVKTRAVTPPEDKRNLVTITQRSEQSQTMKKQIDGSIWQVKGTKHGLQVNMEEKFLKADKSSGEARRGVKRTTRLVKGGTSTANQRQLM